MTTYTFTRAFPLLRANVGGLAAHLTAVPGDELHSDVDDVGVTCFLLVRGDGGAETPVRTALAEFRAYVREH
ncbi:hypothetical protein [Myxococcus sp. AS-1-15]|uniref:hypothetical protein n=1 Tax=Myxococcus sp. AS-1-15 TaxID=2874600 RepID=UPI001CBCC509|nr:hypothetical protein [Myxococcus sp. AS-1-15]MBZ4402008.1 hypothetical protein [Myxococcus sp. AS-1-15]